MQFKRPIERGQPEAARTAQRAEPAIRELINALRDELAESGAILVLLDQQQKLIIARLPEALLENAQSMSTQIQALSAARSTRQRLSRELAEVLGGAAVSPFSQLAARAPSQHQRLLRALVGEINSILFYCQQRLLQNKVLLGPPPCEAPLTRKKGALLFFGLN